MIAIRRRFLVAILATGIPLAVASVADALAGPAPYLNGADLRDAAEYSLRLDHERREMKISGVPEIVDKGRVYYRDMDLTVTQYYAVFPVRYSWMEDGKRETMTAWVAFKATHEVLGEGKDTPAATFYGVFGDYATAKREAAYHKQRQW